MQSKICSGVFMGGEIEPGVFHAEWNPDVKDEPRIPAAETGSESSDDS